jgi:hypothetical protein
MPAPEQSRYLVKIARRGIDREFTQTRHVGILICCVVIVNMEVASALHHQRHSTVLSESRVHLYASTVSVSNEGEFGS